MTDKRFFIVLLLLIAGLTSLVAGINLALDRESSSEAQNSFVVYDAQGSALYSYNGNLAACSVYTTRPTSTPSLPREILHRT